MINLTSFDRYLDSINNSSKRSTLSNIYLSRIREAEISKKEKKNPLLSLTPRELELLKMVIEGSTNRQISNSLGISLNTVRNHTVAIYRKLKAANRTEAAFIYMQKEIEKRVAEEAEKIAAKNKEENMEKKSTATKEKSNPKFKKRKSVSEILDEMSKD